MKKPVLAALAVATFALTPAAQAQAPAGDSVVGSFNEFPFTFQVEARSGPIGDNPSGTARWSFFAGPVDSESWNVAITCLSVTGNTAVVGFTGTRFFFGERPVAGLFRVMDGGGPDSGQDRFEFAPVEGPVGGAPIPGPTNCSSYPAAFTPRDTPAGRFHHNEIGDIVIIDASPLPTAKDQCKRGGWRTFGVFRNQGDCVSFVATGGKNPPAASP